VPVNQQLLPLAETWRRMPAEVPWATRRSARGSVQGGKERMDSLIRLLEAGRVDPKPMTMHRFAFDQVDRAFFLMETKEDEIIKPLISFHG